MCDHADTHSLHSLRQTTAGAPIGNPHHLLLSKGVGVLDASDVAMESLQTSHVSGAEDSCIVTFTSCTAVTMQNVRAISCRSCGAPLGLLHHESSSSLAVAADVFESSDVLESASLQLMLHHVSTSPSAEQAANKYAQFSSVRYLANAISDAAESKLLNSLRCSNFQAFSFLGEASGGRAIQVAGLSYHSYMTDD